MYPSATDRDFVRRLIVHERFEEAHAVMEGLRRSGAMATSDMLALDGAIKVARGEFAAAEAIFGSLIEARAADADVFANMAACHRAQGRLDSALACIEAALSKEPENVRYSLFMAECMMSKHEPQRAKSIAQTLLGRHPDLAEAHAMVGLAERALGDLPAALAALHRAVAIAPTSADLWMNVAALESALHRRPQAVAASAKALELDPAAPETAVCHARHLTGVGDYAVAERVLLRASALAPNSVDVHEALATARILNGGDASALADLLRIVRAQPSDVLGLTALARVMVVLGDRAKALALAEDLLRKNPELLMGLELKAECLLALGRIEEPWAQTCEPEALLGNAIRAEPVSSIEDLVFALRFLRLLPAQAPLRLVASPALRPLIMRARHADVHFVDSLPAEADAVAIEALPPLLHRALKAQSWGEPYLAPDPDRADVWRRAVSPVAKPVLGLVWRPGDRTLGRLPLVAAVRRAFPSAGLVNLTVDLGMQDHGPPDDALLDASPHLTDHDELLAAIAAVDRLVCVNSLQAHMAGALGKAALLLTRPGRHWMWAETGGVSLWYPSVRIAEIPHGAAIEALEETIAGFALQCPQSGM